MTRYERNVNQVNADFTAIKNKLIEAGVEVPAGTPTADYAEKVGTLYNRGKQAEYDAFWDDYQDYGKKVGYCRAFGGDCWTDKTFKPKYNITVEDGYGMFAYFAYKNKEKNFKTLLEKQGVTLTFPNAWRIGNLFEGAYITELGVMDFSTVKQASPAYVFHSCQSLHTIEKVILSNVVDFTYTNWFNNCKALENITFEGTIANDIDFHWSTKLTKASIQSIINHLSSTASGKTLILSQVAVDREFEGVSGADFTTIVEGSMSAEWLSLISYKPNWQISLG